VSIILLVEKIVKYVALDSVIDRVSYVLK